MRARTKILFENDKFVFVQHTKPDGGGKFYTIKAVWHYNYKGGNVADMPSFREHFDPGKNRGSSRGNTWKFRDRATAEQLLTVALMKWGAK